MLGPAEAATSGTDGPPATNTADKGADGDTLGPVPVKAQSWRYHPVRRWGPHMALRLGQQPT
jgi:hypothetical protein